MILQSVIIGGKRTTIEIEEHLINAWLLAKHNCFLHNLKPSECRILLVDYIERAITRRPDIPLTAQVREAMYRDITIKLSGSANPVLPIPKHRPSKTRAQLTRLTKEMFNQYGLEFTKKLTIREKNRLERIILTFFKERINLHRAENGDGVYTLKDITFDNDKFQFYFSQDLNEALFNGVVYAIKKAS